jgi:AraC family transcriptional regulator
MNDAIKTAYRERFTTVCDYIAQHLDEPLTLEKLSALACCSPYHFHRQFLAFSGQPLYRYIQWLRLRHASWRLAFNPQDKVIDIALDAGFQSPESFSRAFRNAFGKARVSFGSSRTG